MESTAAWVEAVATCVLSLTAIIGFFLTIRQLKMDRESRTEESDARKVQAQALRDEAEARKSQAAAVAAEMDWRKTEGWLRLLVIYDEERISNARRRVAQGLFDKNGRFKPFAWTDTHLAAWTVLDFFESVALGAERNRFDIEDIWHTFYEPICAYIDTFSHTIRTERQERKDETIYRCLLDLRPKLDELQRAHGGPTVKMSDVEREGFFKAELGHPPLVLTEVNKVEDDEIPF